MFRWKTIFPRSVWPMKLSAWLWWLKIWGMQPPTTFGSIITLVIVSESVTVSPLAEVDLQSKKAVYLGRHTSATLKVMDTRKSIFKFLCLVRLGSVYSSLLLIQRVSCLVFETGMIFFQAMTINFICLNLMVLVLKLRSSHPYTSIWISCQLQSIVKNAQFKVKHDWWTVNSFDFSGSQNSVRWMRLN